MDYAVLKPKEGLVVKDPKTLLALPAEGKKVKMNNYWRRRLEDGDVSMVGGEEKGE